MLSQHPHVYVILTLVSFDALCDKIKGDPPDGPGGDSDPGLGGRGGTSDICCLSNYM